MVGKSAYKKLEGRLNKFPQGAPPSETLYKILSILFSEKEAELVSQLPIKPFTINTASRIWKLNKVNTEKVLDELASRAILMDYLDQKLLSELFHQYLNIEDDFIKDLFIDGETKMGRTFVREEVLSNDNLVSILDYEKASHIIKTATHIGVSMCYCRHKMEHLGKACDAPMDICMTFNNVAKSLAKNNYARKVEVSECMELLDKAYEHNLVQCGENVKNNVSFICNVSSKKIRDAPSDSNHFLHSKN
jgi:hypothetical protein